MNRTCRRLLGPVAAAGIVAALVAPPVSAMDAPSRPTGRELAGAWLAREADKGVMAGPTGRSDWGLTVDALFGLYASGVGETAARRIESTVEAHAGMYLGPDLYRDRDVRLGGSAAALLMTAVVTGNDPTSFGHGRYARAGRAYDMRAEVLDLLASRHSDQPGRIEDRGTGSDSTNMFSQSLAVIGLARSGGGHQRALKFLLTQQCRGGYFRMFYNDAKTCDQANGTPDIDGTAVAVEALVTARANGSGGLAGPIARARGWLERVQRPDGSFGGVGSSEPPNANTTGLAARALHSTGSRTAYRKARQWVGRLQVRPRRSVGSLRSEVGAIAYDPAAYSGARGAGIDDNGRDQWRRATAQATFALAPTSLARLGNAAPTGDPAVPKVRPGADSDEGQDNQDAPEGDTQAPDDETPAPDDANENDNGNENDNTEKPDDPGNGSDSDKAPKSPAVRSPSARLGGFIADRLVDGTHVEVSEDGERYVDYDLTADAVIALRVLGERPDAARTATKFLLRKGSVAAYAHGAPYEKQDAAYAEPLAKLSLIAHWLPRKETDRAATAIVDRLASLQNDDGGFDDEGKFPDRSMSTERQSWSALALRAAGREAEADAAVDAIKSVQCGDGGFAPDLTKRECSIGTPAATGLAVQALNAIGPGATPTGNYTATADRSAAQPTEPDDALVRAADFLYGYGSASDALPASTGGPDWESLAALASGRQAVGLDGGFLAERVAGQLHRDGGLGLVANPRKPGDVEASVRAAPALAGRSLIGAPGSPLTSATDVPAGLSNAAPQPAPAADRDALAPAWVVYGLAALLAVVLLLAAILLAVRIAQSRKGRAA